MELLDTIQNLSSKIREIKEREIKETDFYDLSVANLHYVDVISRMDNPTFVALANALGLSKPSVTIMVNKLVKQGFVKKTKSSEDGRIFYLSLTEKGEKIVKINNVAQHKFVEHIRSKLSSEELENLTTLLKKVV